MPRVWFPCECKMHAPRHALLDCGKTRGPLRTCVRLCAVGVAILASFRGFKSILRTLVPCLPPAGPTLRSTSPCPSRPTSTARVRVASA
jgi:hypothetical protein